MEITIYDHQIYHVNRSKVENREDSLIYKDADGVLHKIDFEKCAINYSKANPQSDGRCIGERNIEKWYFLLYTSGLPTKIVFKNHFVLLKNTIFPLFIKDCKDFDNKKD